MGSKVEWQTKARGSSAGQSWFRRPDNSLDKQGVKIFDLLPIAVVAIDLDHNIIYINSAAEGFTGKSRVESIGCKCFELMRIDKCNPETCLTSRAMKEDRNFNIETTAVT